MHTLVEALRQDYTGIDYPLDIKMRDAGIEWGGFGVDMIYESTQAKCQGPQIVRECASEARNRDIVE